MSARRADGREPLRAHPRPAALSQCSAHPLIHVPAAPGTRSRLSGSQRSARVARGRSRTDTLRSARRRWTTCTERASSTEILSPRSARHPRRSKNPPPLPPPPAPEIDRTSDCCSHPTSCALLLPLSILIENTSELGRGLKLADFGSCRGIYSKQPYTEYISTRWYPCSRVLAHGRLLRPGDGPVGRRVRACHRARARADAAGDLTPSARSCVFFEITSCTRSSRARTSSIRSTEYTRCVIGEWLCPALRSTGGSKRFRPPPP